MSESLIKISKYSSKVSYLIESKVSTKSTREFAGMIAVGLSSFKLLPSVVRMFLSRSVDLPKLAKFIKACLKGLMSISPGIGLVFSMLILNLLLVLIF